MAKLLKTWIVPEFQHKEFAGTLFQSMLFQEYDAYIPRKGVIAFADEPFGLIARVPRTDYDSRPRRLDGKPDERYKLLSPVHRSWYTIGEIIALCNNAIKDGDISGFTKYVGRATFQGQCFGAFPLDNAVFVFEIPSLPIYFEGRFGSLRIVLSLMERMVSQVPVR